MKTKYIFYIAIVLVLGYLIFNRISKQNEADKSSKSFGKSASKAIRVNGIIISTQNFSNQLDLSGAIEANEQVQIRSEVSGLVKYINFKEGSNVSKGQVLLKIDDRELQAQLSQAKTKEKLAFEISNRASKLLKAEAISQEEFDNASAELNTLKAQSQLIRAQLSKTEVRAPFSGKIGLRTISVGAYVTPMTEIANLVSINPVKIAFSVPEKYTQLVKLGTQINFTVAGSTNKFTAKVYAKEPSINVETRTLVLKALANNPDGFLLPGTFTNVSLPLEDISSAILIPSEAVIPILKGKQVYILKNGKAEAIQIESNLRTDENVLVTKGLSVGDTVITSGIMAIQPGADVKVKIVKAKDN